MLKTAFGNERYTIFGVGVDIERASRFKGALKNSSFIRKIFTPKEIRYCKRFSDPEIHLAARFAGKEAIWKAIGSPYNRNLAFNEIGIENRRDGKPFVNLKKTNLTKRVECLISLSHSNGMVAAFSLVREKI